tara:strand:- start:3382 stop:3660 length:279 start_codon:yes stop_codon:yes gene_type:complete
MRVAYILALIAVIFVLTYKPKERYTPLNYTGGEAITIQPKVHSSEPNCCGKDTYRANNPTQCENVYFQANQFASETTGCPMRLPPARLGAIL